MTTTTSLPRYEAWPVRPPYEGCLPIPAQVRKVWYDDKGRRCMAYPLECNGHTEQLANETAAICAVALAAHFGGVADVSRVQPRQRRVKRRAKG